MIIFDMLQKTYRIIRNRSDTVTRSKTILTKAKQITQNSGKLIAEVKADGIHLDDFPKLKAWGGQLRTETENLVNEVGALGEKIEVNTLTENIKKKIE